MVVILPRTSGGKVFAGFVNVAWDGGVHAFILDTMVAARELIALPSRRGQAERVSRG